MQKSRIAILVVILLVATIVAIAIVFIHRTNFTIVITNSQSIATPAPFQQEISFNPSLYSDYERSDLGNIRFYSGSTELYSWCESGCNYSSTNTIFWVKLPDGIDADSNVTISLKFENTNINYDGKYAGEAPQISQAYGEFDNGYNVFSFYDNFAGTTLNTTKWNNIGSDGMQGSQADILVDNGLVLLQESQGLLDSQNWIASTANGAEFNRPIFVDVYAQADAQRIGRTNFRFGFEDTLPTAYTTGNGGGLGGGSNFKELWFFTTVTNSTFSSTALSDLNVPAISQFQIYTVYATNKSFGSYINYIPTDPPSTSNDIPGYSPYIGIILANNYQPTNVNVDWVRTRAAPPNNIMPSTVILSS